MESNWEMHNDHLCGNGEPRIELCMNLAPGGEYRDECGQIRLIATTELNGYSLALFAVKVLQPDELEQLYAKLQRVAEYLNMHNVLDILCRVDEIMVKRQGELNERIVL